MPHRRGGVHMTCGERLIDPTTGKALRDPATGKVLLNPCKSVCNGFYTVSLSGISVSSGCEPYSGVYYQVIDADPASLTASFTDTGSSGYMGGLVSEGATGCPPCVTNSVDNYFKLQTLGSTGGVSLTASVPIFQCSLNNPIAGGTYSNTLSNAVASGGVATITLGSPAMGPSSVPSSLAVSGADFAAFSDGTYGCPFTFPPIASSATLPVSTAACPDGSNLVYGLWASGGSGAGAYYALGWGPNSPGFSNRTDKFVMEVQINSTHSGVLMYVSPTLLGTYTCTDPNASPQTLTVT